MKDRILYRQAIESARCLEEGVLEHVARRQHRFDLRHRLSRLDRRRAAVRQPVGVTKFVERADELAEEVGPRFAPPKLLRDLAAKNKTLA